MYTVQDVMTREVISLAERDDLALAENLMFFGRFHHLPVVRDGKLVGLVSEHDLLRTLASMGEAHGRTLLAREVMVSPVEKVSPGMRLKNALRVMLRKGYGCLPVVDREGRLAGILTLSDATRFAARMLADLEGVERGLQASRA